MDSLRKHLLACSRLSGQQHRYIGHRHFLRQRHSIFQRLGLSQYGIERVRPPHLLLQLLQADIHCGLLYRTADEGNNLVIVISFGDIIESPILDGLHPVGDIAVGGQQNDFHIGSRLFDGQHQVYPVPVGQKHITQSYIGVLDFQLSQSSPAITGLADFVSFQLHHTCQQGTDLHLVVND